MRVEDIGLSRQEEAALDRAWDRVARRDEVAFRTVGTGKGRHVIPVEEGGGGRTVQPLERGPSGTWKPDPEASPVKQTPAQQAKNRAIEAKVAGIHATGGKIEHEESAALSQGLIDRVFRDQALTPEHLVTLTGAGEGAQVKFRKGERGIEVEIAHRDYQMTREFYRTAGKVICENHFFGLKEHARGRGTDIFSRQVQALRTAGVDEIRTHAYRDDERGIVGYTVWPKLGYDGSLDTDTRDRLPSTLKGAKRVSDLMRSPAGRAWWQENGDGIKLTFDLAPDSLSSRVLSAYRQERAKAGPHPHHLEALAAHERTRKAGRETIPGTPEREAASRQHAMTTRHLITLAEEVKGAPIGGEGSDRAKEARSILEGKREDDMGQAKGKSEDQVEDIQLEQGDDELLDQIWNEMGGDDSRGDAVGFITVKKGEEEGKVVPVNITKGPGGAVTRQLMTKTPKGRWVANPEAPRRRLTAQQIATHIAIRQRIANTTANPTKRARHLSEVRRLRSEVQTNAKSGMPATTNRPPLAAPPSEPVQAPQAAPVNQPSPPPIQAPPAPAVQAPEAHPWSPSGTGKPGLSRIKPVDKNKIKVADWHEERVQTNLKNIFGPAATVEQFAALSGSHDATSYSISPYGTSLEVHVKHPDYSMTRTFRKVGNQIICHNDIFRANRPGTGNSSVFAQQVMNMHAAGVSKIETSAAHGPGWNGYYTWPRLGYDIEMSKANFSGSIPAKFAGMERLSDIMKSEDGRAWWKDKGRWNEVEFDLSKGSISMQVLTAYARTKGYPVPDWVEPSDGHGVPVAPTGRSPRGQSSRSRAASTTPQPAGQEVSTESRFNGLREYASAKAAMRKLGPSDLITAHRAAQERYKAAVASLIEIAKSMAPMPAAIRRSPREQANWAVRTVSGKEVPTEAAAPPNERQAAINQFRNAQRAYEQAGYPSQYEEPEIHAALTSAQNRLHAKAERISGTPLSRNTTERTAQAIEILNRPVAAGQASQPAAAPSTRLSPVQASSFSSAALSRYERAMTELRTTGRAEPHRSEMQSFIEAAERVSGKPVPGQTRSERIAKARQILEAAKYNQDLPPDSRLPMPRSLNSQAEQQAQSTTTSNPEGDQRRSQQLLNARMAMRNHQRVMYRGANPNQTAPEIIATARSITGRPAAGSSREEMVRNSLKAIHEWSVANDPEYSNTTSEFETSRYA